MAKRGVLTHRKTRHLARLLGLSLPFALGVLEALWHATAQSAPAGDLGKLTDQEIADSIWWEGDPETLVAALVESKWLADDDTYRLVVVGWSEHAEDSIHAKLFRAVQCFADGNKPLPRSIGREERMRLDAQWLETHGASPATVSERPATAEACPVEPEKSPETIDGQTNMSGGHMSDESRRPTKPSQAKPSQAINPPVSPQGDSGDANGSPPKGKRQRAPATDPRKIPVPEELHALPGFTELWCRWLDHLMAKSPRPTESAIEEQLEFLVSQTRPLEIVRKSLRCNWKGVFPLKAGDEGYDGPAAPAPNQPPTRPVTGSAAAREAIRRRQEETDGP